MKIWLKILKVLFAICEGLGIVILACLSFTTCSMWVLIIGSVVIIICQVCIELIVELEDKLC